MEPIPTSRSGFRVSLRRAAGLGGVVLGLLGGVHRGVAAEPHWAFQPVREPAIPVVTNAAWCRTPLDRFILTRLESAGRTPAPEANRRTLIRRLSFDLTGLPPSAGETAAFESDTDPDAHERLVDRLLASPRYGERWGRHWLDVVRYADTAGETADYPVPVAWRYRNYVLDAFNADKPYDSFLREQVAGDILAREGPRELHAERVTATGFLALSRRFGFDSENYHHLTLQDSIDTLGQATLGLTLGCARCHAHKFDPISSADYYALYGIFESTRYAFPGSEQKQRHRALVPLVPPEESHERWAAFENRVAALSTRLERFQKAVPSAVLRSLAETDGDFEMQAPAAGGSKGVLVPPWVHEGPISVTTGAQSPFRSLHPMGKVGVSVAGGTNGFRVLQAIQPVRLRGESAALHANLDFRITPGAGPSVPHRFWVGRSASEPAVEVLLSADSASIRTGGRVDLLRPLAAGEWQSLQLRIDLGAGTVAGRIGRPGDMTAFPSRALAAGWEGVLAEFGVDALPAEGAVRDAIAFDHLTVQDLPILAVSTQPAVPAFATGEADPAVVRRRLTELVGMDGDFELQSTAKPPALPWQPGPNSIVQVQAESQSPFRNVFPRGRLGIRLPNSGAYNGFGQPLDRRWTADKAGLLHAGFDFRITDLGAGGDGSWRFYLGHGPGPSAAVELFLNGTEFFRRSGDAREPVTTLRPGDWYQVRITLDLREKRYAGWIASTSGRTEFAGEVASGWDGSIDHTFLDSYGHRGGVKPAIDVDNFVVREAELPAFGSGPVPAPRNPEARIEEIASLRAKEAGFAAEADRTRKELEALLAEGPFEMAYAVSEGTPRDARIQLRGEPDRPGDRVARGLLPALGGGAIPGSTFGSGRRELADWLASPTNPLTARVMVNRIWQSHFGQGLVRTPNDFGTRGQRPSHPELLDHLATEFVRDGWSIKAMQRRIVNSATYRQQSEWSRDPGPTGTGNDGCPACADPGAALRPSGTVAGSGGTADLFSPFRRRRLDAEELRDAILLASGTLDPSPGRGHPFPGPTSWGFTQHGPYAGVYDHTRRSVYLMTQRIRRHPFLALFDGADPNASTAERRTTTVPTQALYFLNDPFVHAGAEAFAGRTGIPGTDAITEAYRIALGRDPSAGERSEAEAFLAAYRKEAATGSEKDPERATRAALGRVLFGSNEFLTVD